MRIKSVILENFRAYKNKTIIPFSNLTAFIGKNDAGKSTILEALDIFFEGGTVKMEVSDACKGGNAKSVDIGIVFDDLPSELVLDSKTLTTFKNEFLLNEDGLLEIHKTFNCALSSPKLTISARAVHPTAEPYGGLLQLNQKDLKALIKSSSLENKCNQTENPSMRLALYDSAQELNLKQVDVPLNEENGKAVWSAIQGYLPIFALFQSDRPSNDQDPEVQNPMKLAVEKALETLEAELNAITDEVQKKAQETAQRTLDKLQQSYPNLASTLQPKFKKPPWKNIFKMDLEADDGIPLNKRGSGVRRLVLMSFFQAEAENRRKLSLEGGQKSRPVIYAIEEPETSQHPDNQEQIIKTLLDLAAAGDQVIITTHVPGLAGLVPLDSLRFVDKSPADKAVRVREGTPDICMEIADELGVLPDAVPEDGLKVAVLVEGKNDIDALRSLIGVLVAANEIQPLDEAKIFWTIGGGSALKDWVERCYLDKLNLPQVIIQDSDRSNVAMPLSQDKVDWLAAMAARPNVSAFVTHKRNMDNYVHPDVIIRQTGGGLNMPAAMNFDYDRMSETMSPILTTARANGLLFAPTDHAGNLLNKTNKNGCKAIICSYFMRHMTADEIKQRATYQDNAGVNQHEVHNWIGAIAAHL